MQAGKGPVRKTYSSFPPFGCPFPVCTLAQIAIFEHKRIRFSGVFAMRARIYRPARTAMQSGTAKTKLWVLEFSPAQARKIDPLMGWTSSGDMDQQVRLRFEDQASAEAYARAHGIDFVVIAPKTRRPNLRPGGYGDNFATNRRQVWTH
jgi:hypothetical protein